MSEPLLRVEKLSKRYPIRGGFFGRETGAVHAVDNVSFELQPARRSVWLAKAVAESRPPGAAC